MAKKIGMISLGCPKNQVDAEIMLGKLREAGFEITPDESEADAVIVNTCGFLESAVSEAIENIVEVAQFKNNGHLKALVVTGCMAERYRDQISEEMPEVDVVVGIGKNAEIVDIINKALSGSNENRFAEKDDLPLDGDRVLTTPSYTAYLRIADGCDNCCSFCAIPLIRGRFRSRKIENVVAEAEKLVSGGARELVVIAQDTTRYGEDIYGRPMLAELLKQLDKIGGLRWIRILYTYPDRITDDLLYTIRDCERVLPYLDIPIQHCSAHILRDMNRTGDRRQLTALLTYIREIVPDITLRTTLITGFPGESEDDFNELCDFLQEVEFDRLGCFPYSAEDGTPAAGFPDQVDPQLRQDRSEIIMNDQLAVVNRKNNAKIGSVVEVLIEGYDSYIRCYFGRSKADAPDIDGKVFFISPRPLVIGEIVNVLVNDTIEYDLLGELWEDDEK